MYCPCGNLIQEHQGEYLDYCKRCSDEIETCLGEIINAKKETK